MRPEVAVLGALAWVGLTLSCSSLATAEPELHPSIELFPAVKGFDYGFWSPLSSAPSVLGWRFGIDVGDLPTNLQDALREVSSIKLANYVGRSTQRVSLQIPRPLGPALFAGELKAVGRFNAAIIAYRVPSLPSEEAGARELFDFAKSMNIETIISDRAPADTALIDMMSRAYGIDVALCDSYQRTVEAVRGAGPTVGACLNNAKMAQEGVTPEQAVADLKSRIFIVELEEPAGASRGGATDARALFGTLYAHGVTPKLVVMRATDGSGASQVQNLEQRVHDLDVALRPLIADRAAELSRIPDQGRGQESGVQRQARASYTAGNSTAWDPATPDRRAAIDAALPQHAIVAPKKARKLLVMDLNLGYPGHASILTHNYGLRELGIKTGAYQAIFDNNLDNLKYPKIKDYDAIFLNNTVGLIFEDPEVRAGLLRYVREGGGLGANHASIYAAMDWPEFAEMMGAFPSAHLEPTERVWFKLDDPRSPLNAGFHGKEFLYQDEYVRFIDPLYSRQRLHILLSIDVSKTDMAQMPKPGTTTLTLGREDSDYAISWIRLYGKGRVFYTGVGHNPTMFSTPEIARHVLGGLQFILGDLPADATPSAKKP